MTYSEMSVDQMKAEVTAAIDEANRLAPELCALFNRSDSRMANVIAVGATFGSNCKDKDELMRMLTLVSATACAEFELKEAQRERIANADA